MVGRWEALNSSPLIADAYAEAWNRPAAIGDGIIALLGIDHPTPRQLVGAAAIGECIAHFNAFFRSLASRS
jgi:hypothetical protein